MSLKKIVTEDLKDVFPERIRDTLIEKFLAADFWSEVTPQEGENILAEFRAGRPKGMEFIPPDEYQSSEKAGFLKDLVATLAARSYSGDGVLINQAMWLADVVCQVLESRGKRLT